MNDFEMRILKEWELILRNISEYAVVGRVNGIKFIIRTNENTGENRPHLHIETSSASISVAIDNGDILAYQGKISPPQLKMAKQWMHNNKAFVSSKWNELSNGIHISMQQHNTTIWQFYLPKLRYDSNALKSFNTEDFIIGDIDMNNYITSIQEFIANVNIRQALLVDGEWGCGKTYFIKNEIITQTLINTEDNESLVIHYAYISLFGIDNPIKLMTRINSEFFSIYGEEVGRKYSRKPNLKHHENFLEQQSKQKIKKSIISFMSIAQGKFLTEDMCQALFDTLDFKFAPKKRFVIIFDDFERSKIDIEMLMGIINLLAEHKGMRVIVVANTEKIDEAKIDAFTGRKEKIIGAKILYKPDSSDTISGIINALKNTKVDYINFLNKEIDAISDICKIANVFNARSIQRTIAVFSQIFRMFKNKMLSDTLISSVFRGFILMILLSDNGQIMVSEYEIFMEYPWNTVMLTDFIFERFITNSSGISQNEDQSPSPEDQRKKIARKIIHNYPFSTSYPIRDSLVKFFTTGIWNNEEVEADCDYYKDLENVIDEALSKIVNIRFYEYDNILQLQYAVARICQNIRNGEYTLNLVYRIVRAFESLEFYKLIPQLHIELHNAIDFWIKNTNEEDMYKKNTPIEQRESKHSSGLEIPEYDVIIVLIDNVYDRILHKYMLKDYEKKCENLLDLIRHEDIHNLLYISEFTDVICGKFDTTSIALCDVHTLMQWIDSSHGMVFSQGNTDAEGNNRRYDNLMRLCSSVNQYVDSCEDPLHLFYLMELQKRLNSQIVKFIKPGLSTIEGQTN